VRFAKIPNEPRPNSNPNPNAEVAVYANACPVFRVAICILQMHNVIFRLNQTDIPCDHRLFSVWGSVRWWGAGEGSAPSPVKKSVAFRQPVVETGLYTAGK